MQMIWSHRENEYSEIEQQILKGRINGVKTSGRSIKFWLDGVDEKFKEQKAMYRAVYCCDGSKDSLQR